MEIEYSLDELDQVAEQLVVFAGDQKVIAFYGEMGVGKTTLIRSICMRWGVKDLTSSPTFSIINEYSDPQGASIYHMDLYRIHSMEEAFAAGIEDVIRSGEKCLVEWPERIPELFRPSETMIVQLEILPENRRRLRIIV
jgi:tRNA threonylcarbamoyladenosine biosynthesis protein TsaE